MDNEYREKILRDCSKEYILNMAEAFRHGLKMWREAYRAEVGDVRYQELLQKISGEPTLGEPKWRGPNVPNR